MNYVGVHELIAAAQVAAASLPDETHQSFPLPDHSSQHYKVVFLFCPSSVNLKEGLRLRPPEYVVEMDATNGKLISMRHVNQKDFGLADFPDDLTVYLGRYDMLPGKRTPEQFHELHGRLITTYDVLIPAYGDRSLQTAPANRQAAHDFCTLFPQVAEQPLLEYYHIIGKDFFAWLDQVGR